jgi:hypothetical protein
VEEPEDVAGTLAEPEEAPALPEDLTQDERVRKWQSAVDKKRAEDQKRIADLEAKLAAAEKQATTQVSDDPIPKLDKERDKMLEEYTSVSNAMAKAKGDERDALVVKQWQLRRKIYDADVQRYAYMHGADPDDPKFAEAYDSNEIRGPQDVERLALLLAKGGSGIDKRAESLKKREAALKEREEAIETLLKQERAKLRRELGLDDVPGASTPPAGKVKPEDKILQEYRALKESGKSGRIVMKELLRMKLDNPEAFATQ